MSGWVRPEGPESMATYWSRRLVVIAAAVVVLVLGIVLVTTAAQGSEPSTAGPALAPTTGASASAPAPTPSAASPSASTSTSPGASTSTSPASSVSPSGRARSVPSDSVRVSTAPSPSTSAPQTTPGAPSATPSTPVTPICDPTRLRTTLQGDASPEVGQRVVFSLSVINGNGQSCVLKRNAALAELKIHSGTDRIWSTDDCITLVPSTRQVLEPEQAVAWTLAWNGRRSAPGCKVAPATPRAGTYFATFQLVGAKPVQQRMILTAS